MVLSVDDSTASSATTAWDETDKRDTLANTIDDLGETILKAVRERLNVEHYAHADETDQDDVLRHRKEAGRVDFGLQSARPSTAAGGRQDGKAFYETDNAVLTYWDEDGAEWHTISSPTHGGLRTTYTTGTMDFTNGSAVVSGTDTDWDGNISANDMVLGADSEYYMVASVDSDTQITLDRNYDGTTAAGQSYTIYLDGHPGYLPKGGGTVNGDLTAGGDLAVGGDQTIAGTLTVTGATTLAAGSIGTDEIANDAVTAAKIDSVLGAWAAKSDNTVYEAATDGFVCAYQALGTSTLTGYTDGSNPPTTIRHFNSVTGITQQAHGLMMPVKKGDFWRTIGAASVYWIPLGA